MRSKKLTQQQRIVALEKAVTSLYAMIQAIIDKINDNKETKQDIKTPN
jgi:hypothetical protein